MVSTANKNLSKCSVILVLCAKITIKRVTLSQNILVICKNCSILCLDLHVRLLYCSSDFLGPGKKKRKHIYYFSHLHYIISIWIEFLCFAFNNVLLFPVLKPQLFSKSFFVAVYTALKLPFKSGCITFNIGFIVLHFLCFRL